MAEDHLVRLKTERFRSSLDPLWVRIRHLLIQGDMDPLSMILAYFAEEDFRFRFGILVNEDARVYQFGFSFAGGKSRDGLFVEWEDITDTWKGTPFQRFVAYGLALREQERKDLRS